MSKLVTRAADVTQAMLDTALEAASLYASRPLDSQAIMGIMARVESRHQVDLGPVYRGESESYIIDYVQRAREGR